MLIFFLIFITWDNELSKKKENRDILLFRKFAHLYYKDPNVLGVFLVFF